MQARASYQQYTVVKGDTLAAIAARFGSTVQAIAETSGIKDPNKISVGQVLSIPVADLSEVKVTSAPKTPPQKLLDTSPGTASGLASWFQPPRLWFTIGALATLAFAIMRGNRNR